MIVLISPENDLPNELDVLNQLFEAGLDFYHLRKPNKSKEEHQAYLKQINSKFHDQVIIHNYHELTTNFQLKGIHLEERKWREKGDGLYDYVSAFQQKGFSVSSSYHEIDDLEVQKVTFDYYMISPVFAAISKAGYEGRGFNVRHIDKTIVGMGGINQQTTPKALKLGFSGVGTLGGIWNANDPIEAFKGIQNAFQNFDSP